jgi:hypothetical protein
MKGNSGGIDLYRQFIDEFHKEEMLAFFDFQADTEHNGTLSGLCKVSRPKPGKSDSRYLSLLFIIETPDEQAWKEAQTRFGRIPWDGLQGRFPEFESALSIPFTLREFTGNHFQEVDIYLKEGTLISRSFILGTLCPSVFSVAGIRAGEPVFREDLPDSCKDPERAIQENNAPGASLVSRLRALFKP